MNFKKGSEDILFINIGKAGVFTESAKAIFCGFHILKKCTFVFLLLRT